MNKVTRIHMQIVGFLCMAAGLTLIATGSLRGDDMVFIVAGFILFNTMMNAGPNLATYTIPSEVFPVRLRASGHGLVHCPKNSRGQFGRLMAASFVALPRKTLGMAASRASLATRIHPEFTPGTSRTVHWRPVPASSARRQACCS